MKRIILAASVLAVLSACLTANAQSSFESVLNQIEKNNPSLQAKASETDAAKLANRQNALLENPEVEFNYLWGASNIGNRHDIRVSQSFDIATLSGMKSKQVSGMNELSALEYEAERLNVLLEAKQDLIDLVYANAMKKEITTHLQQAQKMVSSIEKRIKAGDATVLDLNKAKVHLTSVQGEMTENDVQRQSLLSSLKSLNGGNDISFDGVSYDLAETLPEDFEAWYQEASDKNPVLEYVRKEVEVDQKQLQVSKTQWVPQLSVGYMDEIRSVEKFRGVTLGVSIPLWSNSNKVRQNRAQVAAAESRQKAAEQEFYYKLQNEYNQASSLKKNYEMMKASLADTDTRDYLLEAQSKGEISMIDYLVEIDMYYEALEKTLSAECDYRHALAELNAFEL